MTRGDQSGMLKGPVDVLGSGAVILGPKVTCDGFHVDRPIRVQTHIHTDHMNGFTSSLAGEVVMTKPTRDLLAHDHPALTERLNVHVLKYGDTWEHEGQLVELFSSGHMLGAAQAKVTLEDSMTVGYSGDFNWPLQDVIKVDALVVDATYGNPNSADRCSQAAVQEALVTLVRDKLRHGPVHLYADIGPCERALLILGMSDVLEGAPTIASKRVCDVAEVSRAHGRPLPVLLSDRSEVAVAAIRGGHYLRVWGLSDEGFFDGLYDDGVAISLTKYRTGLEPYIEVAENHFRFGLSNHADFDGTVEYVEASGAQFVVTDSHRAGKSDRADVLAKMLRTQLKIKARVSSNHESREWGH